MSNKRAGDREQGWLSACKDGALPVSKIVSGSGHAYYTLRAEQERIAAEQASDPVARRVHLELAQLYAEELAAPSTPGMSATG